MQVMMGAETQAQWTEEDISEDNKSGFDLKSTQSMFHWTSYSLTPVVVVSSMYGNSCSGTDYCKRGSQSALSIQSPTH